MSKIRYWLGPFVVFVILVFIVGITAYWYHQGQKSHELEKANQISYFISKSLSREINYRMQALKVVARQMRMPPGNSEFENLAKFLQSEYSGFFALNFVSKEGIIQHVYPESENQAAKGHNLLTERPEVKDYMLEAKSSGEPRVSHRLLTYQKIYAVVIYVPLFDSQNQFFGWLNGVFNIDRALMEFMNIEHLSNASIRVRWHHLADTNTLSVNWENPQRFQTTEYKIMNQTVSIDLALGETPLGITRRQLYFMTILLRLFLLLIISYLVIKLTLSRVNLNVANEKLAFNNAMLTSLSHDIATPLTALNITTQLAVRDNEITGNAAKVIPMLEKVIEDMLKSVRMLHAHGSGTQAIPIESVPVLKSLNDALSIVDIMAKEKTVHFEISESIDSKLQVKANQHTLVNNVLLNVLTNSIKFSNPGSKITIGLDLKAGQVDLIFIDQGKGISSENIERFKRTLRMSPDIGTHGEAGTGLGLLQISGFMKIYGGHFTLENAPDQGAKLTLSFKKA